MHFRNYRRFLNSVVRHEVTETTCLGILLLRILLLAILNASMFARLRSAHAVAILTIHPNASNWNTSTLPRRNGVVPSLRPTRIRILRLHPSSLLQMQSVHNNVFKKCSQSMIVFASFCVKRLNMDMGDSLNTFPDFDSCTWKEPKAYRCRRCTWEGPQT